MVDGEPKPETEELPEAATAADGEAPAGEAAPEPGAADEAEAGAEQFDPLAEQAARIAELEAKAQALGDERLRALAEVENMRRRSERERREASRYGATALARDLLGVADNLRRALASGGGGEGLLRASRWWSENSAPLSPATTLHASRPRRTLRPQPPPGDVRGRGGGRGARHGRAGRPGRLPSPRPPAEAGDGGRCQGAGSRGGRGYRRSGKGCRRVTAVLLGLAHTPHSAVVPKRAIGYPRRIGANVAPSDLFRADPGEH